MAALRKFFINFMFVLLWLLSRSADVLAVDAEDAHSTGCLPQLTQNLTPTPVCQTCHKKQPKLFATNSDKVCTTYCMTCHPKEEMSRHHTVNTILNKTPDDEMHMVLTTEKKIACITCHEMSRLRYDKVRWKSTSLFDRMFRHEDKYKTYFLTMQNDSGKLCLTCH
jgi:hypothetical protein